MKPGKQIYTILVLSVIFLAACGSKNEEAKTEQPRFVKVENVVDQQQQEKLVFNGSVKEKSLISVSFRVGGPLVKVNVNSGDFVRKGQLIAVIDKRDYEIQVQTTKAQYEQLSGEYKRYKELFEKNKIPANTYEKIESGYLMAKSAYDNALNQLKDTELRAPISGYIHEKLVETHQTVGAGMPIVSILDLSQIEVVVSVPENQLLKVKYCKQYFVDVKNAGVSQQEVSLLSIGEKTQGDGLYEVKFKMNNAEIGNVYPGMTAEITIYCPDETQGITIPSSAVFNKKGKDFVWIYNAKTGKINAQQVMVSKLKSNGKVEILSGLSQSDRIVTAGATFLQEGQHVQPIPEPSKSNVGGLL